VQRLFSTFPEGWPGTGLLFLRAATAIPLLQFILGPPTPGLSLLVTLQLLVATCSTLLLLGFWTPIAGLLLAAAEVSLLFFRFSGASMHIVLAVLGASLAMTGPGAWSMDARRYGRKRIRVL
jgi:uncharacterized membrane protein YphA (DoxX/SURF4 family)